MKSRINYISLSLLLLVVIGFSACRQEVEFDMANVPVRLSIPVRESNMVRHMPAELGDPGMAEAFDFPKYAYIFLVCETTNGSTTETIVSTLLEEELVDTLWVKDSYAGALSAEGDPIYRYTGNMTIGMPESGRTAARVYAALSPEKLTLNNTNPESEEDVQKLEFMVHSGLTTKLQNLYSSPYNYMVEGKYYGTVEDITQAKPHVDLMLYHVASKVDLMWNVPDSVQSKMKVKGLTINNLYNGTSFLFKPTENVVESAISGYSTTLATDNPGTWWLGRECVYTIPYKFNGKFPVQLTYTLEDTENSAATKTYNLTINKKMTGASAIFVPWVRGQMTFTQVKEGSETKEVD